MDNSTGSMNIWMWLAGAFFTAWNGLLTLILGYHYSQISKFQTDASKTAKELSQEREEHCIPRNECERTHHAVDVRLKSIEEGVIGVHKRLDDLIKLGGGK